MSTFAGLVRTPRSAAWTFRSWTCSAATRYAFVGRQATFGQEPPQRSRSTIATLAPSSRARAAPSRAAEPAPRTRRRTRTADVTLRAVQDERQLVAALRSGDEAAFRDLITRYHATLVRVAQMYVPTRAVAEEVA